MKCSCLLLLFTCMILIAGVSRADLVRTLPTTVDPGQEFTVELTVNLPAEGAWFVIEEPVPTSFSVSDQGDFIFVPSVREMRTVNLSVLTGPITLSYDLWAPTTPGDYFWESGAFAMGNPAWTTNIIEGIVGDNQLTVTPVPAAVVLGILGLGVAGLKLRKFA